MNIRGIRSKLEEVRSFIEDENIDVMVLCETKLEKEEERNIEEYKGFFLNNKTAAGGVMILAKENIRIKMVKNG